MTWPLLQTMPAQWHGVGSESDQELRTRVGSESMAALRARRERPSWVREEDSGRVVKRKSRVIICSSASIFFFFFLATRSYRE